MLCSSFRNYDNKTASMAQWVRAWVLLSHGHAVWEVGSSNPSRNTIVEVFYPTRELTRFSPPNMPSIVN